MEKMLNVVMDPKVSIANKNLSYKETLRMVAEQMVSAHIAPELSPRPYIAQKGVRYEGFCRDIRFDAKAFYPEAKVGDVVYSACNIWIEKEYELWLNFVGCGKIFLDGKCIFSSLGEAMESEKSGKYISIPLELKKEGKHFLVIKSVCTEEGFGYLLNLSPPRCPSLWANFYLVMARTQLPLDTMEKEEGIAVSPLCEGSKTVEEAYAKSFDFEKFPVYSFPKKEAESKEIDFGKIYKEGNFAFAYSEALDDTEMEILAFGECKIIVNGEEKRLLRTGETVRLGLKKNNTLLLKCKNTVKGWGFVEISLSNIGLSWLDTDRKEEFRFALCGPFFHENMSSKLPPENDGTLLKTYPDGRGGRVFWRFQNAHLRVYSDSSFFGQWYYATMLAFLGVLHAGLALDEAKYAEYFLNNQKFLADWYEYAMYETDTFGSAPFMMSAGAKEKVLDHIGTMGVNFAEAYQLTGDEHYLLFVERLNGQIKNKVTRFPDGTFCRKTSQTMWADDMFMSCPFLIRLYSHLGDEDALSDIVRQVRGFRERLYLPEEKIFSHIYFMDTKLKNKIPWGRGNGWIAVALSEILERLSPERDEFKEIKEVFAEFCEGIASVQDECGLWHQVLNRKESYLETSSSVMFTLAFLRGVRGGWIDKKYEENIEKGLSAVLSRCVDEKGVIYGVCMGSSCSMDAQYYFDLPSVKNDNHGTGLLMTLLYETIKYDEQKSNHEI